MPAEKDWLQENHFKLMTQAASTHVYLNNKENQVRMGFEGVNLDFLNNDFNLKYVAYSVAFSDWQNPADRTLRIIADFTEKEKIFRAVYRKLYMGYLKYNPNVKDSDLEEMGLPKRRTSGRKASPVPTTIPFFEIDTSVIRHVFIRYEAKPKGVHGIEIISKVSETPITNIKELILFSNETRSPYAFEFEDKDRGKRFYFAVRWENTRGEKGPWSEISSAIIP